MSTVQRKGTDKSSQNTAVWLHSFFFKLSDKWLQRFETKTPPRQYRIHQLARLSGRSWRNHQSLLICKSGWRTLAFHRAPADTSTLASSEGRSRCRTRADSGLEESTCQAPETRNPCLENLQWSLVGECAPRQTVETRSVRH